MDKCHYANVNAVEAEDVDGSETVSRKSLLRQLFVCSGTWACYFTFGLCYGTPTVMIAHMRREANSTDVLSPEIVSWISSTYNYSGFVCAILLAILASLIGRKLSFIFVAFTSIIGWVVFYYSTSITQILISEVIHGALTACQITVSIMILTEYISPRYRGMFLTLKSASFLWGIWVANTIGTFFHWKNIAVLGFMCSMYYLPAAFFWPESPYWLANRGRFKECAESHRWLKGFTRASELELEDLIQSRKNYIKSQKSKNLLKMINRMVISKTFYKPIFLCLLVLALYNFTGKLACGMYAIDIIKKITQSESSAYTGMLILDGITVLGMYIGSFISKVLKRRSLLLVSSTIGILFLFTLSLYLYLIKLGIILENVYISLFLLMAYSLAISVGPMIMATTVLGELLPLKYRSSSVLIMGCAANFNMCAIIKIVPYILRYGSTHGLFLFFGVTASLFAILTYKYLPETKDKTLLEIQESLLGPSVCKIEGISNETGK